MIRCRLHEMQNLLALISNLFQQFGRLLSGGDRWFLVLDEGLLIQENSARQYKKSQYADPQRLRRENFNRQYEAQRQFSSEGLTIAEIWSVLNPFSIVNFLAVPKDLYPYLTPSYLAKFAEASDGAIT